MKPTLFLIIPILAGCVTQKKCLEKFPPQTKDSSSYVETVRLDTVRLPADTSMSQYLIECQKTADGYKARIIQLLTQKPGEHLPPPTATISGDTLKAMGRTPKKEVVIQVREVEKYILKKEVLPGKVTNVLKWWQKMFMWIGIVGVLIGAIRLGFFLFKTYRKVMPFVVLLLFGIGASGQTTGTYWRVKTTATPFGKNLRDSTLVRVTDTAIWFTLTHSVGASQTIRDAIRLGYCKPDGASRQIIRDTLFVNTIKSDPYAGDGTGSTGINIVGQNIQTGTNTRSVVTSSGNAIMSIEEGEGYQNIGTDLTQRWKKTISFYKTTARRSVNSDPFEDPGRASTSNMTEYRLDTLGIYKKEGVGTLGIASYPWGDVICDKITIGGDAFNGVKIYRGAFVSQSPDAYVEVPGATAQSAYMVVPIIPSVMYTVDVIGINPVSGGVWLHRPDTEAATEDLGFILIYLK